MLGTLVGQVLEALHVDDELWHGERRRAAVHVEPLRRLRPYELQEELVDALRFGPVTRTLDKHDLRVGQVSYRRRSVSWWRRWVVGARDDEHLRIASHRIVEARGHRRHVPNRAGLALLFDPQIARERVRR